MVLAVAIGHELWRALSFAFGMTWEVLWALILGFALSAVEEARAEADKGRLGSMEGHAEMDMSVEAGGRSLWQRLRSPEGFTAIADYFVMDWAAVARDVFGGLLIAGALAAWVPSSFWQGFFLEHHGTVAKFWGPVVGPAVAIVSFVCSIGNVPLAAVLWNGGISFGGVLSFIFADPIILPMLDIYRRYYGWRMAGFLLVTFYATMVTAGLTVEFLFQGLGIERHDRNAKVVMASVSWNYTTLLNIVFLLLAAALIWRYFHRGGGWAMLKMMNKPMGEGHHAHAGAHAH